MRGVDCDDEWSNGNDEEEDEKYTDAYEPPKSLKVR